MNRPARRPHAELVLTATAVARSTAWCQRLPRDCTEAVWQRWVIDTARRYGWLIFHQRPAINASGAWSTAITGHKGWPDLALIHPANAVALFRELKSRTGRLSPEQITALDAMRDAGLNAEVWRPSDQDEAANALTFGTMQVLP